MHALLADLRHAFRILRNNPGFTFVAVLTLALGISVNTTVFSWVDNMLLRPFPGIQAPESLALAEIHNASGEFRNGMSFTDYLDYRDHAKLLSGLAVARFTPLSLGGDGRPRRAWGELVSGNYFDLLGVKPVLGRTFLPEEGRREAGSGPVVVISYQLWKDYFHSDPRVLGKRLRVNRNELSVVGVAPPAFLGTTPGLAYDLWAPLNMATAMGTGTGTLRYRGTRDLTTTIARLRAGVTLAQASAEMMALSNRLAAAYPDTNRGLSVWLVPLYAGHAGAQVLLQTPLRILAAVSMLLLLIVCANVANLLLARGVARRREFGIRLAMGARPLRILRQLFTETLFLAGLGAGAGVLISPWMVQTLRLLLPPLDVPLRFESATGWRTVAFTALLCIVVTLICGMAPALLALRTSLRESIESSGRGGASRSTHRLRAALVVSEVALASVALIGAGLFLRSFRNATEIHPGFDTRDITVSQFYLSASGYTGAEQRQFCRALRERLESVPGVTAVSYADQVPMGLGMMPVHALSIPGYAARPEEDMNIGRMFTAPGFPATLGIALLQGRDFTDADADKAPPVMLVNESFVRRFLRNGPAVGARLQVERRWTTIVGVVRDCKYDSLTENGRAFFYLPFRQRFEPGLNFNFYVKSTGNQAVVAQAMQREALKLNQDAIFTSTSLTQSIQGSLYPQRVAATLMGFLGSVCLILAGIGLYSVMNYAVSQRTREMGIRVALGARPVQIVRVVVGEGLTMALVRSSIWQ
ncbi:ABC transporter permease [uncultured Paludibaculum sp.]|uniref:ABC transporter permease n=1 Tax=uncultured Paludibaculum sp. TaxID=1765020 RepID=UPI002AAAEC58|nr:ABC transporter permease [uncultured Paludibaculum sp.]